MVRSALFLAISVVTTALAVLIGAPPSSAQTPAPVCGRNASVPTEELGVPNLQGETKTGQLGDPDDERAYRFLISDPSAVFVYVGDQWYDLDLAVYSISLNKSIACWSTTGAKARSERSGFRQIQLVRPDETIIEAIEPGVYVLLVGADQQFVNNPGALAGFDASKSFTIRVAAGPLMCGLDPANIPNPRGGSDPAYQGVKTRPDDAWYQIGMAYQPLLPTPFSLVTFTVIVSPPYTDLFDFAWELDGKPVPNSNVSTVQMAGNAIGSGQHKIKVTAKGVREYPDPDQPHIPLNGGTLSVECPVIVR